MKNSDEPRTKSSKVEKDMNNFTVGIIFFQFLCCLFCAIGNLLLCKEENSVY